MPKEYYCRREPVYHYGAFRFWMTISRGADYGLVQMFLNTSERGNRA